MYKTTVATINNIVHRLKKKNIIHKNDEGLLIVNPVLNKLDFSKDLTIVTTISLPKDIVTPEMKMKVTPKISKENEIRQDELPNLLNVQKYG